MHLLIGALRPQARDALSTPLIQPAASAGTMGTTNAASLRASGAQHTSHLGGIEKKIEERT